MVWRRVNIHSSALTFSGEETPWQVGGWRGGKGGGASISLAAWGRDGGGGTFFWESGEKINVLLPGCRPLMGHSTCNTPLSPPSSTPPSPLLSILNVVV